MVDAIQTSIWFQNFYRLRKKVLALTNEYWIEDRAGNQIGYTKQKLVRIKEDIRIFSDESMTQEIFRIQQEQVLDIWGTFAVIDTYSNQVVGKIKRAITSGITVDEYFILDQAGQQIGRVVERTGRGLLRKYIPGGNLVPEEMVVEFYGRLVTEIKQQFKLLGDLWEVDCSLLPPQFDRRVLLAGMILMAMIERDRK